MCPDTISLNLLFSSFFLHCQWAESFSKSLITAKLNFSASHWQQKAFTFLPIKLWNLVYFYYGAKKMYRTSICVRSGIDALCCSASLCSNRKTGLHEQLIILGLINVNHLSQHCFDCIERESWLWSPHQNDVQSCFKNLFGGIILYNPIFMYVKMKK